MKNLTDFYPILPLLPNASCKDITNPNLFFPVSRQDEAKSLPIARTICAGCPERKECLDYALKENIGEGIWAGTTPAERGMARRRWHNKASGKPNRSEMIRALHSKGRPPREIATTVRMELSYVNRVLKRVAKLEGESQLLKEEKLSGESLSSSESA